MMEPSLETKKEGGPYGKAVCAAGEAEQKGKARAEPKETTDLGDLPRNAQEREPEALRQKEAVPHR